jgi:hypothetical protein
MADVPILRNVFGLAPEEAVAYFRQKGYRIGFDYRDVWQQEHQAGFTVAKAMQLDLLCDIRAEVDAAILQGTTFETFREALMPRLVQRGWWGKQTMIDPLTGEAREVQLGSPRRLKVIYDTNLRTAHAEGQWERIQASKDVLPYLLYDHTPSDYERKEHKAWDGLVLPVDDPWWLVHKPVKAWGCKCTVIPLGARQVERLGLKVGSAPETRYIDYVNKRTGERSRVPAGVDPAFDYPPGGRLANLGQMLADKIEGAPAALGAGVFREAAVEAMPLVMQNYTAWANAVEARGGKGLGGRRVIGAVSTGAVAQLAQMGVVLESAGLSIEQREVTHLFAEERKAGKAVDRSWVYALPERLAAPDVTIYDATPGREALLYAWKEGDHYVRLAVRPNFGLKGKNYTNAVRSAHIVQRYNLEGPGLTVLEGSL